MNREAKRSQAPYVELDAISKRYRDVDAVADVSFDLYPGEVFGYLGPNGAGKTTTLKILAGLISKFDGEVRIGGKRLPEERDAVHRWIGYLPQAAGFQEWRTARSALRSFGLLSGVAPGELEGRIGDWLERFDLSGARNKKIKKLSGGMIQKLGLIQALLHEPQLLILDEPLAGLDPTSRRIVKDVVRECRGRGATVIFSSHILSDVEDVADRIGILHAGTLLTAGSVADLEAELPIAIGIEFSTLPESVEFLRRGERVLDAEEVEPDQWVVRMARGVDVDAVIHSFVEATIQGGGRVRRIGALAADLDALYEQYIRAAEEGRDDQ